MTVWVEVEMLEHGLGLPEYATEGAAGMDLVSAFGKGVWLPPGERLLVPTGIRVEIPAGYEGQVRPRSGLAVHQGVTVLNSPGTVDSDYRGEVCVLLINLGKEGVRIRRGDRIAQLVVAPVARVVCMEVDGVGETERGTGGFGSTGE